MKLMHSLPQQISITHTNGPHLRPCCYKGKQRTRKKHHQQKQKTDNVIVGTFELQTV